jgi:predicted nucleic acid-binding protein
MNAALVSDAFAGWERVRLVAPTLMWSEAASGLSQMFRRGEIGRTAVQDAVARLLAANIEAVDSRELVAEASEVAQELGCAKTYDAEYVVLARRLEIPLLTLDARLRSSVKALIDAVSPAEVDTWT